MKKLFWITLGLSASIYAQSSKDFVGKWDFVKTDLARTEKAALQPSYAVKDFTLEFSADGTIRTTELHRSMSGRWQMSEGGQNIEAEMESGRLLVIPVMERTPEQIIINYRNGIQVMKRTSAENPVLKPTPFPTTVAIKNEQVFGRWKAREIQMQDGTKVPRAEMPNVQFDFKSSGAMQSFSAQK